MCLIVAMRIVRRAYQSHGKTVAVTHGYSQKSWLVAAKLALMKSHPGLTWDEFAKMVGVEPRAFKTYRMPDDSDDYRTMPARTKADIEKLMLKESGEASAQGEAPPLAAPNNLLIQSLAALVVRLAHLSLIEGRMVAGTSRTYGSPVGLSPEDRRAMSAVSRACLINALPDRAAEIHDLLTYCTQPLKVWLPVPEVTKSGLDATVLIHAEEGIPTAEAEELAAGFTGMTAGLEEQLFAKFMELIGRYPEATANTYYTKAREFVVRNPVCHVDDIKQKLNNDLPSLIWIVIQQQFYESLPQSWATQNGEVPICDHCGNAMVAGKAGLVCRTHACAALNSAKSSKAVPVATLLRVSRGIHQYWIEPGIDELRLYDALLAHGEAAELYPFRDRVDIAVEDTGIDLKNYASPETLGTKFKRGIGGLAYYGQRWLVIPDWQVASVPSYLDRLRKAMDRDDVLCMTVSEALTRLTKKVGPNA